MIRNAIHTARARGGAGGAAGLLAVMVGCTGPSTTGPHEGGAEVTPQMLFNGADDFAHDAVAAIMVYVDPNQLGVFEWRSFCTGVLVHERVIQTAGHCIQFLQQQIDDGIVQAPWVSFQQDPDAHFSADPADANPADAGWYEIESMHNNPDNVDFVELRRSPPDAVLAAWGKFHDSGAIVLKKAVEGIAPMKMVRGPGVVGNLLREARCGASDSDRPDPASEHRRSCNLLAVAYGLPEFPPVTIPPVQVRRSALLRYEGIDPLFISTFDGPPGSEFGANCFGDSGAPIVLLGPNGKDRIIVAISSSPADPFGPPCASGALQYRVDTRSHIDFIKGVIESVERGGLEGMTGSRAGKAACPPRPAAADGCQGSRIVCSRPARARSSSGSSAGTGMS
jgi:hypothetical protein